MAVFRRFAAVPGVLRCPLAEADPDSRRPTGVKEASVPAVAVDHRQREAVPQPPVGAFSSAVSPDRSGPATPTRRLLMATDPAGGFQADASPCRGCC